MSQFPITVKDVVQQVLPDLTEEERKSLHDKLWELGVRTPEDFEYLDPPELYSTLTLVNSKKLLKRWRDAIEATTAPMEPSSLQVPTESQPSASNSAYTSGLHATNWAEAFQIPYSKARNSFLDSLKQKKEPSKRDLLDFVRITAGDIHNISKKPGRKAIALIAKRIVLDHMDSLADRIGGNVIGCGYASLASKLEYRIDNLNRTTSSHVEQQPETQKCAPAKRDMYGCVAWNPKLPPGDTVEALRTVQSELMAFYTCGETNTQELMSMMQKTYYLQRQDINAGISMMRAEQEWPWLLSSPYLLAHFRTLTGVDAYQAIGNCMAEKGRGILSFFSENPNASMKSNLESAQEALSTTAE
ncbi:uncharacterized protein LOC135389464 [Ornithodoros turicata]|uniref:uncharacterized protein LOC135389464 n=1 Tax=Ornithodoros turicata TaxID=34597 RepID=UPI003138BCBE